jgi:hypothetical protein
MSVEFKIRVPFVPIMVRFIGGRFEAGTMEVA